MRPAEICPIVEPSDDCGECRTGRVGTPTNARCESTHALRRSGPVEHRGMSRRTVLQGGAALAALSLFGSRAPDLASARRPGSQFVPREVRSPMSTLDFPTRLGEEVIPWLDQPAENPVPDIVGTLLRWEDLNSWITANDEFFTVKHYNLPDIEAGSWQLEMSGLGRHAARSTASGGGCHVRGH